MERKKFFATKKLKEQRESRELSQQEMADALAIILDIRLAKSTYQKWEQGTLSVSFKNAIALSREFKISIKELWRSK